jgi:hypothetical protein
MGSGVRDFGGFHGRSTTAENLAVRLPVVHGQMGKQAAIGLEGCDNSLVFDPLQLRRCHDVVLVTPDYGSRQGLQMLPRLFVEVRAS